MILMTIYPCWSKVIIDIGDASLFNFCTADRTIANDTTYWVNSAWAVRQY